jgi:subtilisin family serine protease
MWLTSLGLSVAMFATPLTNIAQSAKKASSIADGQAKPSHPALSRYAVDLNRLAESSPVVGQHTAELSRVVNILAEASDRNPLLIGQAGEGSNADVNEIALGLARRINSGNVPAALENKRVFSLNLNKLAAGTKDADQFVARFQSVLIEAANSNVILFVDQLHQFAGTYAQEQATAAMRQAMAESHLQIVGAATSETYAKYIADDQSVAKFFQTVKIGVAGDRASERAAAKLLSREERGFVGEIISSDLREAMQSAKSSNDRLDVILQSADVRDEHLGSFLKRNGVLISSEMAEVGAMKVQIPVKAIEKLAHSGMADFMSPNVELKTLGHVTATTGTDLVRSQSGGCVLGLICLSTVDGTGIGIAVLDSGIDKDHRAFKNGIKFKKDFTTENNADQDPFGHGSHVASTAGGTSTTNGNSYEGIAPNASIINLRVLNSQGTGSSAVLLNALNWFLTPADPTKAASSSNPLNKDKWGIRVVNMSLGAPAINSYKNDPVCRAARALVDAGLVVVAAAGNNGKDINGNKIYGQIHSPGNEPSVITVGATNTFGTTARNDDGVATYSSRGPTRSYVTNANGVKDYDNIVKPDVVAPGNKVIYAESDMAGSDNLLVSLHPELDSGITDSDNKKLMYLSGTSMATPVVAGTAALLLQINPKLTPNMVKAILMWTAQPLAGFNMLEQGAGQVNVEGAVRIAKQVRTDLTNSTPTGSPFLTTNTPPTPQTTIGGNTFTWSQGLIMKYSYMTGANLILKYQPIYGLGIVLGDGDVAGDGIMVNDGIMVSDNIVMGDNILTSNGLTMGDGLPFLPVSQLMGDGIMVSDGIVLGDGICMGDGIMVSDGIVLGDAYVQAMSSRALIGGDDTDSMH